MSKNIGDGQPTTQLPSSDDVPGQEHSASARLLRAEVLWHDSRMAESPPSARIVAAFDVIYLCCLHCKELTPREENDDVHANSDVVLAVADLIAPAIGKLSLPEDDIGLALRLMQWSFFGLAEDTPCTPGRASDLAQDVLRSTQQFHSNSGDNRR